MSGATLGAERSPFDAISIDGVTRTTSRNTGMGGNVGVDVTYMLTDMIGVGGLIRYTAASISPDKLAPEGVSEWEPKPTSIDVGGLQVGGGLRLRFPSFF